LILWGLDSNRGFWDYSSPIHQAFIHHVLNTNPPTWVNQPLYNIYIYIICIIVISHPFIIYSSSIHPSRIYHSSTIQPSALRIHPPDVISKYAPESIVGKLGGGAPAAPAPAAVAAPAASAAQPLLNKGHEEMGISGPKNVAYF
jgi:hypothetical protein